MATTRYEDPSVATKHRLILELRRTLELTRDPRVEGYLIFLRSYGDTLTDDQVLDLVARLNRTWESEGGLMP